jgi:hypothetical protein
MSDLARGPDGSLLCGGDAHRASLQHGAPGDTRTGVGLHQTDQCETWAQRKRRKAREAITGKPERWEPPVKYKPAKDSPAGERERARLRAKCAAYRARKAAAKAADVAQRRHVLPSVAQIGPPLFVRRGRAAGDRKAPGKMSVTGSMVAGEAPDGFECPRCARERERQRLKMQRHRKRQKARNESDGLQRAAVASPAG